MSIKERLTGRRDKKVDKQTRVDEPEEVEHKLPKLDDYDKRVALYDRPIEESAVEAALGLYEKFGNLSADQLKTILNEIINSLYVAAESAYGQIFGIPDQQSAIDIRDSANNIAFNVYMAKCEVDAGVVTKETFRQIPIDYRMQLSIPLIEDAYDDASTLLEISKQTVINQQSTRTKSKRQLPRQQRLVQVEKASQAIERLAKHKANLGVILPDNLDEEIVKSNGRFFRPTTQDQILEVAILKAVIDIHMPSVRQTERLNSIEKCSRALGVHSLVEHAMVQASSVRRLPAELNPPKNVKLSFLQKIITQQPSNPEHILYQMLAKNMETSSNIPPNDFVSQAFIREVQISELRAKKLFENGGATSCVDKPAVRSFAQDVAEHQLVINNTTATKDEPRDDTFKKSAPKQDIPQPPINVFNKRGVGAVGAVGLVAFSTIASTGAAAAAESPNAEQGNSASSIQVVFAPKTLDEINANKASRPQSTETTVKSSDQDAGRRASKQDVGNTQKKGAKKSKNDETVIEIPDSEDGIGSIIDSEEPQQDVSKKTQEKGEDPIEHSLVPEVSPSLPPEMGDIHEQESPQKNDGQEDATIKDNPNDPPEAKDGPKEADKSKDDSSKDGEIPSPEQDSDDQNTDLPDTEISTGGTADPETEGDNEGVIGTPEQPVEQPGPDIERGNDKDKDKDNGPKDMRPGNDGQNPENNDVTQPKPDPEEQEPPRDVTISAPRPFIPGTVKGSGSLDGFGISDEPTSDTNSDGGTFIQSLIPEVHASTEPTDEGEIISIGDSEGVVTQSPEASTEGPSTEAQIGSVATMHVIEVDVQPDDDLARPETVLRLDTNGGPDVARDIVPAEVAAETITQLEIERLSEDYSEAFSIFTKLEAELIAINPEFAEKYRDNYDLAGWIETYANTTMVEMLVQLGDENKEISEIVNTRLAYALLLSMYPEITDIKGDDSWHDKIVQAANIAPDYILDMAKNDSQRKMMQEFYETYRQEEFDRIKGDILPSLQSAESIGGDVFRMKAIVSLIASAKASADFNAYESHVSPDSEPKKPHKPESLPNDDNKEPETVTDKNERREKALKYMSKYTSKERDGVNRWTNISKAFDWMTGGLTKEELKTYGISKDYALTPKEASGAIANLRVESYMNPKQNQHNGGGKGLAQWGNHVDGGRWNNVVLPFAKKHNLDPYDLKTQILVIIHEAQDRGDWDDLKETDTVYEATKSFMDKYEQPGIPHFDVRLKLAREVFSVWRKAQDSMNGKTTPNHDSNNRTTKERTEQYAQELGLKVSDLKTISYGDGGFRGWVIKDKAAKNKLDIVDMYPDRYKRLPKDATDDSHRMFNRQCVSYVLEVLKARGYDTPIWGGASHFPDGPDGPYHVGDAMGWDTNARADKSKATIVKKPQKNDVIQYDEDGPMHNWKGHVAIVELKTDSGIVISEYNFNNSSSFSIRFIPNEHLEHPELSKIIEFIRFNKK